MQYASLLIKWVCGVGLWALRSSSIVVKRILLGMMLPSGEREYTGLNNYPCHVEVYGGKDTLAPIRNMRPEYW